MAKEFDMQDYPGGKLNAFSTTCYGVNTLAGYTGIHDYASVPRRIGQSFPRGTRAKAWHATPIPSATRDQ